MNDAHTAVTAADPNPLMDEFAVNDRLLTALAALAPNASAMREAIVDVLGLPGARGPSRDGAVAEIHVQTALFAFETGLNATQTRVWREVVGGLVRGIADATLNSPDQVFAAFTESVRRFVSAAGEDAAPGDPDREEAERLAAERAGEEERRAEAEAEAAAAAAADKKGKKKKPSAKEAAAAEEAAAAAAEEAARAAEAAERDAAEAAARLREPRVLTASQVRAMATEVSSSLCLHFRLYRAALRPGFYEPKSRTERVEVSVEAALPLGGGGGLDAAEQYMARIKAEEEARAAEKAVGEAAGEAEQREEEEKVVEEEQVAEEQVAQEQVQAAKLATSEELSGSDLDSLRAEMERRLEENRQALDERLRRLEAAAVAN